MRELNIEHVKFAEFAEEILSRGSSFRFRAKGISMRPFLRHGDVLTIEPVEGSAAKYGDILFCLVNEQKIVVHRYVSKIDSEGEKQLIVKGDASWLAGEHIKEQHVIGRVVAVCRDDKMINLKYLWYKLAVFVWIKTSPVSPLLFSLAGKFFRKFSGKISGNSAYK